MFYFFLHCTFLGARFSIVTDVGMYVQVEDARAAMLLYQKHRKQWERSIKDFIRLKKKQKKRKQKCKTNEGDSDV